jgi:NADPH2:quinone reductase
MRAIVVPREGGGLASVTIGSVPAPIPGPNEVRIAVGAVSLNPVDWKLAESGNPNWSYPHVLGLDAAGTVDAIGPGVTTVKLGERIAFHANLNRNGVFAEHAITPVHTLFRVPDNVSLRDAAAIPCAGMTAFLALFRKARLQPGDTILVQGAKGGVGGFAVQLASAAGARVIGLARPEHHALVRNLGAETVLDYRADDLAAQVRRLTTDEAGVDILLEVANPGDARISLAFIHYNGQLLSIDPLPDMSRITPYTHAASVHEIALGGAFGAGHLASQRDFAVMGQALLDALSAGTLNPMIDTVVDFDAIPEWLHRLHRRETVGKVVAEL